jgi:hypothetical protein
MKTFIFTLLFTTTLLLSACSDNTMPLTDSEMAAEHNMTMEEFKENKSAAARMNMTIEEHFKMLK